MAEKFLIVSKKKYFLYGMIWNQANGNLQCLLRKRKKILQKSILGPSETEPVRSRAVKKSVQTRFNNLNFLLIKVQDYTNENVA